MTRNRPLTANAIAALLVLAAAPAMAQGPDIDKVNGSITAEAGQAYGDLETVNGSIRIETGAALQDAETVNGSIKADDRIQADSLSTVNGSIRLGTDARLAGSIETVNGSVFVDRGGQLHEVTTVNGAIGLVDSDLSGGIETVNGDITVGAGSHVRGGIHVEKPSGNQWFSMGKRKPPRIVIGPDARVDGPLVFEREVKLYVHRSATIGSIRGATAVRYDGDRAPQD